MKRKGANYTVAEKYQKGKQISSAAVTTVMRFHKDHTMTWPTLHEEEREHLTSLRNVSRFLRGRGYTPAWRYAPRDIKGITGERATFINQVVIYVEGPKSENGFRKPMNGLARRYGLSCNEIGGSIYEERPSPSSPYLASQLEYWNPPDLEDAELKPAKKLGKEVLHHESGS